ncbi:MAG: putative N-acetylmannosamine-6-phosphate 2-epimerase, partial [Propionibacteriaceae bacterium]|nr:putative N-acetylmannosamine-6-phosphate 2-epimerase [Propionibacteriaceae bacterium]
EPMLDPRTMTQIAQAAVAGGAAGIRGKGLEDLRQMRAALDVPVIGLVKVGDEGVYITPTLADAIEVADTGCEIVALDGTRRERPDGRTLAETITELKAARPGILVMADCGSATDADAAQAGGADLLGTTLAGYTGERPRTPGPDWDCLAEVIDLARVPVIAEGRMYAPTDAARAIAMGAWSVVVGTAITHPTTITGWFATAVDDVAGDDAEGQRAEEQGGGA